VLDANVELLVIDPERALDDLLADLALDLRVRTGEGPDEVGSGDDPGERAVGVDDREPLRAPASRQVRATWRQPGHTYGHAIAWIRD
jgi:hypothetical protein